MDVGYETESAGSYQLARELLDEALMGLRDISDPSLSVREAEAGISEALGRLYDAQASRGSYAAFQQHLAHALEALRSALATLQATPSDDAHVDVELERLGRALGELTQLRASFTDEPAVPAAAEKVGATLGEPALVRFERLALRPAIPLPDPPEAEPPPPQPADVPQVRTLEELDELLARTEASMEPSTEPAQEEPSDTIPPSAPDTIPPPAGETDGSLELFGEPTAPGILLEQRAEAMLEDIASFGRMRRPEPDLPWLHAEETERRLLTRLDGLIACGEDVFPHLVKRLEDRPLPDPELCWSLLFVYGSIDGQDALDQVRRLLRVAPLEDPTVASAVANALMLAPHAGIVGELQPWLTHVTPEKRRIAVSALGERRALSLEQVLAACDDVDVEVATHGARLLALLPPPVPAHVFYRPLAHGEPAVVREAIASAMAHRREVGLRRALELCEATDTRVADAPMFVAVGAPYDEARRALAHAAAAEGGAGVVRALGWLGAADLVEYLIGRLGAEDPAVAAAAADALERITGARLMPDGKEPEYERDDVPFERAWAPPEILPEHCLDPDAWQKWWSRHRRRARPEVRWRWGHPFSPRDDLWQLEDETTTIGERFWAWLELTVRTGASVPLDDHLFAIRQRAHLARFSDHVARLGDRVREGTWPVRYAT